MNIDSAYSHLTLLCAKGLGKTSPNPNVAAALYSESGELISDGFHDRTISPDHAEVIAINRASGRTRGATLIVSLEPCSHQGTTPPCTTSIIDAGIAKVIFAVADPNEIASGGAEILRQAGVIVQHSPSLALAKVQRSWLHKISTDRPLLIWKIAATIDGKIAARDGTSKWVSSQGSRDDVQLLRSQSDAILIGTETAIVDNPHLIPRGYSNRPTRVVMGERTIPDTHHLHDEFAKTLFVKSHSTSDLLSTLKTERFNQVLIESGPKLGTALIKDGLIDELIIYQAPKLLGSGSAFVEDLGINSLNNHLALDLLSVTQIESDLKVHYKLTRGA